MALPPSLPFEQLPAEGDAALEDASGTKKTAGVEADLWRPTSLEKKIVILWDM